MRSVILVAVAAALIGAVQPAEAQTARYRGYPAAPAQPQPRSTERSYPMYTQPPGQSGDVRWNTPNSNGNLGGPGTGGGGGGGP